MMPSDLQIFSPFRGALSPADTRVESIQQNSIQTAKNVSNIETSGRNNYASKHANNPPIQYPINQDKVYLSEQGKKVAQEGFGNALTEEDQKKIQELKDRENEVRVHEQAHAAAGGQYAGSPSYEYDTGPDGKRYVVSGEVSIDVSEEETPEDTIKKMQIVRSAALAPAEPSSQDLKVASEASQKENQARTEVSNQQVSNDPAGNQEKINETHPPILIKQSQLYQEVSTYQPSIGFFASA